MFRKPKALGAVGLTAYIAKLDYVPEATTIAVLVNPNDTFAVTKPEFEY